MMPGATAWLYAPPPNSSIEQWRMVHIVIGYAPFGGEPLFLERPANRHPWKVKFKSQASITLYFGFSIFFVFSELLFFAFFGVFSCDLRFYCSHPHPDSTSSIKIVLSVG